MENDIEDQRKSEIVETVKLNLQDNHSMAPQKKSKFNRPFFIAIFLVIIILGVYIMRSRPNKDVTERMHHDWIKTMTKDSSLNNDTIGLRHFERHEVTQSSQQSGSEQKQVSMVLPAEIPEDLHKAQTEGMPLQQEWDQRTDSLSKNTTVQHSEAFPNKLIEMKLTHADSGGNNIEMSNNADNKNDFHKTEDDDDRDDGDYEYEDDDDDDDYDDDKDVNKKLLQNELYGSKNTVPTSEQNMTLTNTSIKGAYTNKNTSTDTTNHESQYNRENTVQTNLVNMQLEPGNYVKQEAVNNVNPDQQQVNYVNPGQDNNEMPQLQQTNFDKPEEGQLNKVNPEQTNYMKSELDQANYVKQVQGQENYVNQQQDNYAKPEFEQANYVQPEQSQVNYVNREQANYVQPELGQAYYVKQEQGQANNVNREQAMYAQPEHANYINSEQYRMNNANPEKASYAKSEIGQAYYAKQEQKDFVRPEIEQANYIRPENSNFNKPVESFIKDNNMPSYNGGLNNNQQYPSLSNDVLNGNVASDTRALFQNVNGENGNILDTNRLSQTYQNGYDGSERKVGKQLFNIDTNEVYQANKQPSTKSPYTLSESIESRMKIHKVLKDMHDIVDYGSAKSDEQNTKPWNEDEKREHLYDTNNKVNLFENLRMQVNLQAEPVTGTKPMKPPYKSSIQYPEYLTPINWETNFEHVKAPTFECVPMRTIDKYIRICIHPPSVKSQVSSKLKAESTWEYSALMDMQKALLQNKEAFLIDIGASFGVFSLAAAALNRHVIAVEPYSSHIQVLKQSVALNGFRNHITLFQAVISDRRGKVLIKPLGDHVDNVYIQTVEDDEQSTNYTLVVNTVTLDDIEKICPGRTAVLKIDIPGFEKRALEYSYFFFKYIYVTHVFMHWNTSDKELCLFVTRFFVERGYQPYSDLTRSARLDIQYSASWTNDIVIWKL